MTRTSIGHNGWLSINLGHDNYTAPFELTSSNLNPVISMSFDEAAKFTVDKIASRYDNLHVLLSGGLDSEFVAKTLLSCGIDFTPVIILLTKNEPESWYAHKFCNDNGLSPIILDFSTIEKFYPFAKQMLATSAKMNVMPVVGLMPVVIDQLLPNISLLTGFGDPLNISKNYNEPIGNIFEMWDHDYYLDLATQDKHPGAFFSYTPELFKALILGIDQTANSQEAKSKLYQLLPRPKIHEPVFHLGIDGNLRYMFERNYHKFASMPQDRFVKQFTETEILTLLN